MTLQECYAAMNGDYNDAIGRLFPTAEFPGR